MEAKETYYAHCLFRSRIEARWAVVFDYLEVDWVYELEHYDFGLKYHWDEYEFREHLQEILYEYEDDHDEKREAIRDAYRERYEKRMYLPDFWLPDFEHWVEIKGKLPTHEERIKARELARATREPVSILWGNIPDPQAKHWGQESEIYGGEMNIIALLVVECGVKAVERAFAVARRKRFDQDVKK